MAAAMGLVSCATARSDFAVVLPNGYQIVRGNADEMQIVKNYGRVVVPGPIATYVVSRGVVTGLVQPSEAAPQKAASRSGEAKQGYFVLDTRTGEAAVGLSEADWNARLKALGLPPSPYMTPPLLPK